MLARPGSALQHVIFSLPLVAMVGAVDDQLILSDAYRQQFTNALPRHGVEVLQVSGPRAPASPPCPPAHGNRGGKGSQLPATKAAGLQRPPFCSSPSMRSALLTMSRHFTAPNLLRSTRG